jgi:hypothetical protein
MPCHHHYYARNPYSELAKIEKLITFAVKNYTLHISVVFTCGFKVLRVKIHSGFTLEYELTPRAGTGGL